MTDWTHPRIANPEAFCDENDAMAAAARAAFVRRRDTYAQLVRTKQISAEEAREDLEGWRAIARDWHWIADGEGEPATAATHALRIAALDTAIARWFDQYDRHSGSASDAEMEQLGLIVAMRWWAQRENHPDPKKHRRFWADIGHQYRAQNGHPTRGAMRAAAAAAENAKPSEPERKSA